jgi:hypothetical protein
MATVTAQAPSVNFVSITTSVTTSVVAAPTPLTAARHCQPRSRVRRQ